MRKKIVGVIGGHCCNKKVEQLAHGLGEKLAKVVDYVVTGGLSGVMMAVSKGFKDAGGITIGILPTYDKNDANKYIDIVIPLISLNSWEIPGVIKVKSLDKAIFEVKKRVC